MCGHKAICILDDYKRSGVLLKKLKNNVDELPC